MTGTRAITLAVTMTDEDFHEAVLRFPCDTCKALPGIECRNPRNPSRKASTHAARSAWLWAMYHKGYKAGRENTYQQLGLPLPVPDPAPDPDRGGAPGG